MSRLPTACPLGIAPLFATVVPQKQSIAVEEMGHYVLTVHNQGRQKVSLIVYLEGVNKHWVIISPTQLTLQEGDSAKVVVTITPPRISSCRAGDYQLRFIICSPETSDASSRYVLEADLTIEPFDDPPELHLAATLRAHCNSNNASTACPLGKTHRNPAGTLFQTLLLLTLLLFSCIQIRKGHALSTFVWYPFRAWAMGNQELKESVPAGFFGLALLETTEQAREESRRILHNTPSALTEPIFIAPNWSAPLSSPTPLPTITFIPTATATSTNLPTPTASPLPTATSIPTALPFYPKGTLSPTVLIPKGHAVASPTTASTTSPTESPTTTPPESPTTIPTTTPPESDSHLFASIPTSLMIEPAVTDLTYEEMFKRIGAQYAIDWRLLASVAYQESTLNPLAVGKDGEMGLMQILPTTWDEFAPEVGVSEPFDPYSNVQVGAAYLNYLRGYLVSQSYSEEYWTLVAYNWGPQNMRKLMQQGGNWGDVPPSRQDYAYKIIETVNNYNNHWFESKLKEYISGTSQ